MPFPSTKAVKVLPQLLELLTSKESWPHIHKANTFLLFSCSGSFPAFRLLLCSEQCTTTICTKAKIKLEWLGQFGPIYVGQFRERPTFLTDISSLYIQSSLLPDLETKLTLSSKWNRLSPVQSLLGSDSWTLNLVEKFLIRCEVRNPGGVSTHTLAWKYFRYLAPT